MKIPPLEQYFNQWMLHDPVLVNRYYRRRIACPHGYVNPKYFALIGAAQDDFETAPLEEKAVSRNWAAANCPTYFLQPDFFEAVLATEPVAEYTLDSLHLPLNDMLICLPVEVSIRYFGFLVPFVGYTRCGAIEDHTKHVLAFHGVLIPSDGKPVGYYGRVPCHESVKSLRDYPFKDHTGDQENELQQRWHLGERRLLAHDESVKMPTSAEDLIVTDKVFMVLAKLFLVLNAAPRHLPAELEPINGRPRAPASKPTKSGLWHPVFIGEHFQAQRCETANGHHASPRMHWRRGHIRQQRYGKLNGQVRNVWIEPVLVNSEQKELE